MQLDCNRIKRICNKFLSKSVRLLSLFTILIVADFCFFSRADLRKHHVDWKIRFYFYRNPFSHRIWICLIRKNCTFITVTFTKFFFYVRALDYFCGKLADFSLSCILKEARDTLFPTWHNFSATRKQLSRKDWAISEIDQHHSPSLDHTKLHHPLFFLLFLDKNTREDVLFFI